MDEEGGGPNREGNGGLHRGGRDGKRVQEWGRPGREGAQSRVEGWKEGFRRRHRG